MKYKLVFAAFFLMLFACENSPLSESVPVSTKHALQWVKLFGGSEEDIAHDVIVTKDGGFAVLGNTKSINGDIQDKTVEVSDILLIKFSATAQLEWSKTYGGSLDDRGHSLVQMPDGGFTLLGYSMSSDIDASNNEGQHDNWVLRVDAQGNLMWEKSFGFLGHDHAYSIITTQDGGLLFNGFLDVTSSGGLGSTSKGQRHGVGEFWVHKIDASGNILWRRYYGGTNNDRSYAAVETEEGNFVIVGTTESTDIDISAPRGDYDVWVIKIAANGTLLWERSFGGSEYEGSNAVWLDSKQVLHVFGNTFSTDKDISSPLGSSDFWLISVDQNGNLLSENTFGGTAFDLGRDLLIDKNNHFWLTGYSRSSDIDLSENHGDNDIVLLQLDQNKFPKQHFSLGGSGLDIAHAIVELPQGGILVVGSTESADGSFTGNRGNKDIFLALWDGILE